MSDEVSFSLDSLAALVGMDPSDGLDAIVGKMNEIIAGHKSVKQREQDAKHERRLQDEDKRIVAAAINDGRVAREGKQAWVQALATDRAANRAMLASLASGIPPAEHVVVDEGIERVHNQVLARLGIKPPPRPSSPGTVAAAAPQWSPSPVYDDLGLPIADQFPTPVLLSRGKPYSEWTAQEKQDAMSRRLGPRFSAGLPPQPAGDKWYFPSPNDASEFVDGEWRPKYPYTGRI
jgi:hypothetical protein